ncbi:MAG: EpsG family protein [Gammaproteobacteria bacterium]
MASTARMVTLGTGQIPATAMSIVLLAILAVAFVCFPLLFLLGACVLALTTLNTHFRWLLLLASSLLFVVLNISKQLEGDLVTYVALQEYVANQPFSILFRNQELLVILGSYRVSEIGFYAPLWLLSKIFRNGQIELAVAATLGIYVPVFFALTRIARREGWSDAQLVTVIFFAFFASINFVQTTHLVRQYISSSVALLALTFFMDGRRGIALLLAGVAVSIHNATGLLVANVVLVMTLFPFEKMRPYGLFGWGWRLGATGIAIGASLVLVSIQQIQHLLSPEGNIYAWHYLLIGGFFVAAQIVGKLRRTRPRSQYYMSLAFFVVFFLSLGFFVIGVRLLALRYFSYLEWLLALIFAGMLVVLPRNYLAWQTLTRLAVAAFGTGILLMRIDRSPWNYGDGALDIFTRHLPYVASILG